MSGHEAALFKLDDRAEETLGRFSKMPVIRKFESLLTDEDFVNAGFKVERHPSKSTFYIYASHRATNEDQDQIHSNVLVTRPQVAHNVLWIDPTSNAQEIEVDPISERLNDLRELAADEGLPFNESSAEQAMAWIRAAAFPNRPNVFLVNNGNTRLFWRDGDRQFGIQFLGDNTAQFVFLGEDDQTERIYGSIKVSELVRLISGLDLSSLLGFT